MRGRAGCRLPLRLTGTRLPARRQALRSAGGRAARVPLRHGPPRGVARGGHRARAGGLRGARQRGVGDAARRPTSRRRRAATSGRCRPRGRASRSSSGSPRSREPGGRPARGDGRDLRVVGRRPASCWRSWTCARSPRCAPARWPPWPPRSWPGRTRRPWGSSAAGSTAPGLRAAWPTPSTDRAICFDPDPDAAGRLAGELGWEVGGLDDALACDVVTCVTPGSEPVVAESDMRPGRAPQHARRRRAGQGRGRAGRGGGLRALLRRVGAGLARRRAHRGGRRPASWTARG